MKKTVKLPSNRKNRRHAARNNSKKNSKQIFILVSMATPIHILTAVLDMPEDTGGRLIRIQEILTAVTDNAYVTVPPASLTQANTDFNAYKGAATASERNATFRPIHNDLKGIMSLFQSAADANSENGIVIIESGKFKVKKIALNQKHEFEALNGLVSGMVHLTAEGGPNHSCHDWYYSADGVAFERMLPTVDAHTDKGGLIPGEYAYFKHQLITSSGPQGESQIIRIMVQ